MNFVYGFGMILANKVKLADDQSGKKINNLSAWTGAIIGGYSHIILDSFVNLDMRPYFPFSEKNHLLGLISLQNTYYLCIGLFLVGVIIYVINLYRK